MRTATQSSGDLMMKCRKGCKMLHKSMQCLYKWPVYTFQDLLLPYLGMERLKGFGSKNSIGILHNVTFDFATSLVIVKLISMSNALS